MTVEPTSNGSERASNVGTALGGFSAAALVIILTQGVGFLAFLIAAARLGPSALGAASFAMGVVGYVGLAANFGVGPRATRDLSLTPQLGGEVAGEALSLRLLTSLACSLLIAAAAPLVAAGAVTPDLIRLSALALTFDGVSAEWALLGLRRPLLLAFARLAGQAVYLVLVFLLLGADDPLAAHVFVFLSALSILITSLLCLAFFVRRSGRPRLTLSPRRLLTRLRAGGLLGLGLIVGQVRVYAGPIVLGYVAGAAAVGQYTAAQKVPLAILSLVDLWFSLMLAQLARAIVDGPAAVRSQLGLLITAVACVAAPLATGAAVVGPALIPRLFGPEFTPAGPIFVTLTAATAVAATASSLSALLAAKGHNGRFLGCVSAGGATTLILSIGLGSTEGAPGAAWALLAGETVTALTLAVVVGASVGKLEIDGRRLLGALLASAAMAVLLRLVPSSIDPLWLIALGALAFIALAAPLGVVRPQEIARVMAVLKATSAFGSKT